MATATLERKRTAAPETGDDGYPVRLWNVNGEEVAFPLKPYSAPLPRYYNPISPGSEFRMRSQERNELGMFATIQTERWNEGYFEPKNAWEEHMVRDFIVRRLKQPNPDLWKGDDHPEGGEYRCQCTWHTGNHAAFIAHRRKWQHQELLLD